ncbi:MAG: hypothetical protein ACI4BD_05140 [Paludibacteraceae bacterium]
MKTSWQNKIGRAVRVWLAGMAMAMPLFAQAETASELLAEMAKDTITLAYSNDNTQYYLMVGTNNSVSATLNSTDTTALWEVYDLYGYGFRLRNICANKWLYVSKVSGAYSFSLVDDRNNGTLFFINSVEGAPSPSYSDTGRGFASIYFWGDQYQKMYLYYDASKNKQKWAGQKNAESFMRIEQWTRYYTRAYEITTDYSQWTWPFVDEEHAFAKNQKYSQDYQVWLRTVSYLYCRPDGPNSSLKLQEMNTEVLTDDITPTYYWESNLNPTTTYLTSEQIFNTGEIKEEEPRAMVKATVERGANTGQWIVTMEPQGKSPINLRDKSGNYVNYTDRWVMSVASLSRDEGEPASDICVRPVVRYAGHYKEMDGLYAATSPTNYYFTHDGGNHDFQTTLTLIKGTAILGKDEQVLENSYANNQAGYVFSDTTHTVLHFANVQTVFKATEGDSEAKWLSTEVVATGNTFTLSAAASTQSAPRTAALLATYTYQNGSTYSTSVQTNIYQAGTDEAGEVKMKHQPGAGNTALDENGLQAVHTVEKTIYYLPDIEMELRLNQSTFKGYMRWYDYETGKDPMFDKDGNAIENFWVQEPTTQSGNSYYNFKSINMDGKTSHGRYADKSLITSGSGTGETLVPNPTIKANWSKEQTVGGDGRRDIACDVSCYTDYTITDTAITEPTLSYRQIFHLRPAEEIAKQIGDCTASKGKYFEVHHYTAPTNVNVHLSTNIAHYDNSNLAELCMFYYDKNGTLQRIGNGYNEAVWYKDNVKMSGVTRNGDNVVVESATADTVVYDLRLPSSVSGLAEDLLLVRFYVVFAPYTTYGPMQQTLISEETIEKNYDILAKQDFNFDIPGTTDVKYYNGHLPWNEATYGYVYPEGSTPSYIRAVNTTFPYYGEYTITNRVDQGTWAVGEQHGGAANGYCFYADGTMIPGLVTSVSTDAQICSGQQMYFSAWVCNPNRGTSGDDPVFRFNVQGRNKENGNWTEWENVGQFYTGPISRGGAWYQVVFPIVSEESYTESRVSIYNFAATNSGNDFLVDDICLFASRLPLQAYQATTTCAEDSNEVIISRIDYTRLTGDWAGKLIYYQIYNTEADSALLAKYYRYGEMDAEPYPDSREGYICIPCSEYDPAKTGDPDYQDEHLYMKGDESKMVYNSVTQFIDTLLHLKEQHGRIRAQKAYVKIRDNEQDEGRYVLYIGEVISKDQLKNTGKYQLRMAGAIDELSNPECALQAELPLNHQSTFLFNGEVAPTAGVCANNLYPIDVVVTNQYVDDEGISHTIQANAYADWLAADRADDCYWVDTLNTADNRALADTVFKQKFGYERGKVEDAIRNMRQLPADTRENPNRDISDAENLVITDYLPELQLNILKDLASKGYLHLRQKTAWCYMTSEDTIRYWIYPISGTAETEFEDTTITLNDCNSPSYMRICVNKSDYVFSISPLPRAEMSEQQRGQIPGLRVSASEANKSIATKVGECSEKVSGLVEDSCKLMDTNDPVVLASMKKDGFQMGYHNKLDKVSSVYTLTLSPLDNNTDTMRAGYTYTMRVKLIGSDGGTDGCEVGYSYFKVMVLPDTVVWSPTVSTEWGDDRNWRGIVHGDTLDFGFVPLAEKTNAVIPTIDEPGRYPYLSHNNRYPMDANYSPYGCKDIQFHKNSILLNQHLLDYKRVFIDLVINSAKWYSVAAPLQNMYSGDFYIPHSGKYTGEWENLESTRDFEVGTFQGTRLSDAAYAFAAAYYNKEVKVYHFVDKYSTVVSAKTAAFARSNAMNEALLPGTGLQLRGYGPGEDGEELVVRLPKSDTRYYYYERSTGEASTLYDEIPNRNLGYTFAFAPDKSDSTMTITIDNKEASQYFLFGNPTMAYIDMERFCTDNADKIEKMFQYMDGTTWKTMSPNTGTGAYDDRLVLPMQAVLLTAKEASTSLTLKLKSSHLSGLLQTDLSGDIYERAEKPARAAGRAAAAASDASWDGTVPAVMDLALYTPLADYERQAYATAFAAVATNSGASDDYIQGEDVAFISSGIETADNAVVSPLNLYTLSGEQTMMADIRREVSIIPIGMVVSNEIREDYDSLYLAFRLSPTWSDECYLCDNLTHTRVPIWNDTRVKVPVPAANHELRYYIEGPAYVPAGPDTPTGNGQQGATGEEKGASGAGGTVQVFAPARESLTITASAPIEEVRVFDITGRSLRAVAGDSPIMTIAVPSGIAIVETTLRTGKTVRNKVMVP